MIASRASVSPVSKSDKTPAIIKILFSATCMRPPKILPNGDLAFESLQSLNPRFDTLTKCAQPISNSPQDMRPSPPLVSFQRALSRTFIIVSVIFIVFSVIDLQDELPRSKLTGIRAVENHILSSYPRMSLAGVQSD